MPERDAFGREIGDDPLADLGWGTSEGGSGVPDVTAQPAAAVSTPTAPADEPPQPPPAFTPPGANVWRIARLMRLGITLLVLAAVVVGGIAAISAGRKAVDGVRDTFGQLTSPGATAGGGEEDASLLHRGEFGRAIAALERDAPGPLYGLRLAADRLDVQQRLSGGRLRLVQFRAGAEAAQVISTADAGLPATDLFRYADLRPEAVARALRGTRRRTGTPPAEVGYLVFDKSGGQAEWRVYLGNGGYVEFDGRGRYLGRYRP